METINNNPYQRNHVLKSRIITRNLAVLIFFIVAITAKIFLLLLLPDKYLYDSNHIIDICNGANGYGDKAFEFSANFFIPLVKIFHIKDAKIGSIILGFILNPILIFVLYMKLPEKIRILDCSFISILLFLLNIYVFNISKDLIQFVIDIILIYFMFKVKNNKIQTIIITILLILCSLFFRGYLALVGLIYLYIKMFKTKKIDKKIFILQTIFIFIIITICLFFLNNNLFNNIFNNRDNTNKYRIDSSDAQTIISNLINKDGYFFEILNYLINLIRLLFPIELLFKGNILYIIFILFNILSFITLFLQRKIIKNNNILTSIFTLFISFILVFALFEPDFGSFLRHFIPIAFIMISICLYLPIEEKNYEL